MLSNEEIDIRKPVWSALSELWLDTELQKSDLNMIAEIMFESEYSIEELREIYEKEVAPVVYMNLLSPAGEWAGFNDEWLHEKIISALNSRSRTGKILLKLKTRIMLYATENHWHDLVARIKKMQKNEARLS